MRKIFSVLIKSLVLMAICVGIVVGMYYFNEYFQNNKAKNKIEDKIERIEISQYGDDDFYLLQYAVRANVIQEFKEDDFGAKLKVYYSIPNKGEGEPNQDEADFLVIIKDYRYNIVRLKDNDLNAQIYGLYIGMAENDMINSIPKGFSQMGDVRESEQTFNYSFLNSETNDTIYITLSKDKEISEILVLWNN